MGAGTLIGSTLVAGQRRAGSLFTLQAGTCKSSVAHLAVLSKFFGGLFLLFETLSSASLDNDFVLVYNISNTREEDIT